jgi:predicted glycosyltransferase involved in capsule biosynthesis
MKNPYSFTFIIGYRYNADRMSNLKRTLDWMNSFVSAQIILVEQDKHSKIDHLNLKCERIFTKTNMPYNRSWAFNVGVKYAKTDIIIFADSDIIMKHDDMINGIKMLENYDVVSPFNSLLDLTPQESFLSIENMASIPRPGRGEEDNQKINICSGICIFRKDAVNKIGGWSEDFIGWGGEDDYQSIKVKNFLTWVEMKARAYHLWHSKAKIDPEHYKNSLEILKNVSNLTKEQLANNIANSSRFIGRKNCKFGS